MTTSNLIIHPSMSFDEYQQLPGHSFSSLKANGKVFQPTAKMALGSSIHNYLMDPAAFKGDVRIVKPLAMALKSCLGSLWEYLLMEVSVTCNFEHEGFIMPYRGRIDLGIPKKIVVDLKIAERIDRTMDYFQYPDQVSGYATSIDAPVAFLIAINPKEYNPKPVVKPIKINMGWWETQILMKGEVK